MGIPGLDPETALQLIQTLLYCIACILGGSALLGLSAYAVFLCREISSPQPTSKPLLAKDLQPVGCAPVAEENLDLIRAKTPIRAGAESLSGDAVPVPALPHAARVSMTPVAVALAREPTLAAVSAGSRPREVLAECESYCSVREVSVTRCESGGEKRLVRESGGYWMEVGMKAKIEVVANVVVILLAVVIGSVFLRDRFSAHGSEPNEVKAGDKLPRLDGWDWSAHDRTLVLVLKKGCHFCEDSAPFYQRLAAQQQEDRLNAAIVATFPDAADTVNELVQSEGLGVRALPAVPLETLKVSGTPSLLLVDRSGTVLNAWIGMLSPRQEQEVMRALACPGNSCRERT